MTPRVRSAIRAALIAIGAAATVGAAAAIDLASWRLYATYLGLALALSPFGVEVIRGLAVPVPSVALTTAFVYVAGPTIIALRLLVPPELGMLLYWALPGGAGAPAARWLARFSPRLMRPDAPRQAVATDWAIGSIGLAVRWSVASAVAAPDPPWTDPLAIFAAEAAGYAFWALASMLPVLSFSELFAEARSDAGKRSLFQDLGLIMAPTLTPFIFLITYGYRTDGLPGAAGWSIATLGVHFLLKRLTERRIVVERQNRELAALNRELAHRERLSAIGKMSSVVSHQMLQQLGIIGLHADLVRNADADGDAAAALEQAKRSAGAIEDALGDVNRVLTDLLVFSRDLRVNLAEHRLSATVGESVEACRGQAAARGVELRFDRGDDVAVVLDKLKVKQAIVNVVRNAIEASPAGAEVVVRAAARDDRVEVSVADRGPGVSPGDAERIFAPFYTTKEGGSGLGLAIAREFVQAHGGRISVDAASGRGTTVCIAIPRQPGAPPAPSVPPA